MGCGTRLAALVSAEPPVKFWVSAYYTPFGSVTRTNTTSSNSMLFAGQEEDGATGLHFHTARYYSPLLGRYLSEDPIGFASGDLNLYRYVGNRPNLTFDPSGLQAAEALFVPFFELGISTGAPAAAALPGLLPAAAPLGAAPTATVAGAIGATLGAFGWLIVVVVIVVILCLFFCGGGNATVAPPPDPPGVNPADYPTSTFPGNVGIQRGVGNVRQALPPKTPTTANPPTVNPGSGGGFGKGYYEARVYVPNQPLPRDPRSGKPVPDSEYPHTQLGERTSKQRGETYAQGREFGENGQHVKDIDWTDHDRPTEHDNPHEHPIDPVTGKRGKARPLS
jgi:RHS repeat-associated protein